MAPIILGVKISQQCEICIQAKRLHDLQAPQGDSYLPEIGVVYRVKPTQLDISSHIDRYPQGDTVRTGAQR